jgi:NADPH:quinone reductase-like Zn-dependent oxidoreductase
VRVHAASLGAGDYFGMRGVPFPIRMYIGFPKPKKDHVVGLDLAGRVEAVGRNVTRFKPGDVNRPGSDGDSGPWKSSGGGHLP